MDPLFGCAIWLNCANLLIARDIYICIYINIYICHAQSMDLRYCWIQYESINSAPINGYYGEWPIPVRHLWIAQIYMDPLFGCTIWSNCANSPITRGIYIIILLLRLIFNCIILKIIVRYLWIAQLYMDPLFGCAIWSNCANSPIARDIYTYQ